MIMKIAFVGDVFLGGDLLSNTFLNVSNIGSNTFQNADIRIANLEQAVSNESYVADKSTLFTGSDTLIKLKQLKISAVCLAHNHIHDKTEQGIVDTVSYLEKSNIGHFGAGATLKRAKEPYYITDSLCLLGYCEFGKPYLKQIMVATDESPGVNPLRYDQIINDLESLPDNVKAILYLHWGREHVFLPPYNDIVLAKKLLENNKVALVIGSHAHRLQGYINHNNKRAYMCVGNFLFPNFVIEPPTQIANGFEIDKKMDMTRCYHSVFRPTYKKWRSINRLSIIVTYEPDTAEVSHVGCYQSDEQPIVTELPPYQQRMLNVWLGFLGRTYCLPKGVYLLLEKINTKGFYLGWNLRIRVFMVKQFVKVYGVKELARKFARRIKRGL